MEEKIKIDPQSPAFPNDVQHEGFKYADGLSIRAHFASLAMQSLLSNPDYMTTYEGEKYIREDLYLIKAAVSFADALIAELNK